MSEENRLKERKDWNERKGSQDLTHEVDPARNDGDASAVEAVVFGRGVLLEGKMA